MAKSPYLKPNRLADVIAAIQFMSLHVHSSQRCERCELLPGLMDRRLG
jgi:hypothetical protein